MSLDFLEIFRTVMQLLFGLASGLVEARGLLVNVNVYNTYKPVLVTIKKAFRLPEGFPYTFTVADKTLRASQLLFNIFWIFTRSFLSFNTNNPFFRFYIGHYDKISTPTLSL